MKQKVYLNILNKNQQELLPLIEHFSSDYYLVGGTAIALILGHRESIDFDLFTFKNKNQNNTINILRSQTKLPLTTIHIAKDQSHFILNEVKLTFYNYPHKIESKKLFGAIKTPDLLTLAAMKALALGGRAKWKDYVDLYFILNSGIELKEIIQKSKETFNKDESVFFNERIFLEQMSFYDDISYEEKVYYTEGFEVSEEVIKDYLTNISVDFLNQKLNSNF